MKCYFAPLEGLTDMVYRRTHHMYYPGVDCYYTPFISPTQQHIFTRRQLRELSPENNYGVPLVPQLLGKNAEDFLWAAGELADMGYKEINLNLGCPSGTVTAKGKGAGMLAHPDELEAFLEKIYSSSPLPVSIKTRLGMESPEEFGRILDVYNKFPVCELILHPRTKREMYTGEVHTDSFRYALTKTKIPLCYNGNLFSIDDINRFRVEFPTSRSVMLGRGLICDPSMLVKLSGATASKETLYKFHRDLYEQYIVVFESKSNAVSRMKAIWSMMLSGFDGGERFRKPMIKARHWEDYLSITEEIFQKCDLIQ